MHQKPLSPSATSPGISGASAPLRLVGLALVALLALPAAGLGQALGRSSTGPIIQDFGPVFEVVGRDVPVDPELQYNLVFDVPTGAEDPSSINARFASLARFLNMQGAAGVPLENMNLVLVIHGTAGKDALNSVAFRERYGVDNPNEPLLQALSDAGVEIYMCGQTAMARGLPADELAEPVSLALSALTMLAVYQGQGYGLVSY